MGSFFTNLHVASGSIDAVRKVLEGDAVASKMVPADGGKADRTAVIVPGARWASIYDEDTESQDPKTLDRLGKALSKAVGAPAVGVLVHDSDVLRLSLYEGGKRKDQYDSDPSYFGGKGKRGKPEPHVAAWKHLGPEDHLARVFGDASLFAEAALPVLAEALGVESGRMGTGYRYLVEMGVPADAIVLKWRLKDRPAWTIPAEGPPRLETQWEQAERIWGTKMPPGAVRDTEVAVGGEARMSLTTLNAGGAGKGLVVEVIGGKVANWNKVQLVLGDPREAKWQEQALVIEGDRAVARFPEAAVPPGLGLDLTIDNPAQAMKQMKARYASQVHVNVIGRGVQEGREVVTIRIVPDGGTGTGGAQAIAARSTAGRPLRAPQGLHPMMLAPLEDRSRLVALVVFREAARADELMKALAPWFPTEDKVRTVVYPAAGIGAVGTLAAMMSAITGGGKPKITTGGASGFVGGKRWKDLTDARAAGAGLVTAEWVTDAESTAADASVYVGTGIIPFPDSFEAFAVGIKGAPDDAEKALVAAIDAMAGQVVQAFVTRWGQTPGVDTTPYELSCGVHGQCTLHKPWATRWLRGLGPGWLWLGPELRAHVDLSPLPTTAIGEVVRIEIRDVPAAEAVLAPLLPTTNDWRAGVMKRYGR